MKYGDMTAEQRLQWGLAESAARQADLSELKDQEALDRAQERAVARRRLIGATRQQATRMVIEANRHLRTNPFPAGATA